MILSTVSVIQSGPRQNRPRRVDAIQDHEAVILAAPCDATGPLLRENAVALAGKIVIDATNPRLSLMGDVSGAELLQREAPSALLFKAFNTTGFGNSSGAGPYSLDAMILGLINKPVA
jgi:8-hydroxy-5-deazaflavin:NADPH oxidoreductase